MWVAAKIVGGSVSRELGERWRGGRLRGQEDELRDSS